jgi:hypothetical protein
MILLLMEYNLTSALHTLGMTESVFAAQELSTVDRITRTYDTGKPLARCQTWYERGMKSFFDRLKADVGI